MRRRMLQIELSFRGIMMMSAFGRCSPSKEGICKSLFSLPLQ
jgi:hypothetical protein